jgi:membrane protein implicated in regulation of membrane protease activity
MAYFDILALIFQDMYQELVVWTLFTLAAIVLIRKLYKEASLKSKKCSNCAVKDFKY